MIVTSCAAERDLTASCFFVLRLARHRQIAEPEVVAESSEDSDEGTWHPEQEHEEEEEESSEEEEEEEEEVDDEVAICTVYFWN